MTELERDRLMQFLQTLKQTRFPQYDKLAQTLITEGVGTQPRATYLLVHRCMVLQAELDHARSAMRRAGLALDTGDTMVWERSEADWGVNAQGNAPDESAKTPDALAYLLRDAGTAQTEPYRSLEDKAVLFLGNNAGKVWLGIAAIAAAVVYLVK
jgi:hypothetical protein